MPTNRKIFFDKIRKSLFSGKLNPDQVEGIETILDEWKAAYYSKDPRHLAYILATAYHETGKKMVPVREGFAATDSSARKIVSKYDYGKPDPVTGQVYYGRGHVQLTWAANYKAMGVLLKIPLYEYPDLALNRDTSAKIIVEGMHKGKSGRGDYTGKSLEDYFNLTEDDPVNARRIVNGLDKAKDIAMYYYKFLEAFEASGEVSLV